MIEGAMLLIIIVSWIIDLKGHKAERSSSNKNLELKDSAKD